MVVLHAKGQLGLHEDFVHEGILGTGSSAGSSRRRP
jgi:proline racemase